MSNSKLLLTAAISVGLALGPAQEGLHLKPSHTPVASRRRSGIITAGDGVGTL